MTAKLSEPIKPILKPAMAKTHDEKIVMFAGDIHGNLNHAIELFDVARKSNVDLIIACGDFGYWPHTKWGMKFLKSVEHLAKGIGVPLYWVDGNHENHDAIDNLVQIHGNKNLIPTPSEWVMHIPRGCRFDFNGFTFMGFGGAWSWDWNHRELGETWWKQETITQEQVDALDDEPVDVLITHEAPFGKNISYKDDIITSVVQRELVLEVQNKVNPAFHICGHHHIRETWMSGITEVHVLGRDGSGNESVLFLKFPKNEMDEDETV